MKNDIGFLEKKVYDYKKRFLDIFTGIGFGHLTSAFSWAEIATVLYHEILDISEDYQTSKDRDQVIVSKGHGVGMLFPVFEDLGLLSGERLEDIVKIGGSSRKIRELVLPGYDFYGGSLGIGIGLAAGMAKGMLLSGSKHHVFCVVGDAETYEGSVWEAAGFAGHNRLHNLIVIIDRNELGVSDYTEHMLKLEPIKSRWEAFGWETVEIDGHSISEVYQAFVQMLSSENDCPKCIVAHTRKGNGLEYTIGNPFMHGYIPKGDEIEKAYRELK